ncbi:MAG: hypothetical protein GX221_07400 [Candidatus Riflebacteria bacterium]|nr:hypothetical protein [Candidatus Riflebacteria bacterium]
MISLSFTKQGLIRENNQDAILENRETKIFAIADGNGKNGEIIAKTALKLLEEGLEEGKRTLFSQSGSLDYLNETVERIMKQFPQNSVSIVAIWQNRNFINITAKGECVFATSKNAWKKQKNTSTSFNAGNEIEILLLSEGTLFPEKHKEFIAFPDFTKMPQKTLQERMDALNAYSEELYGGDDRTALLVKFDDSDIYKSAYREIVLSEEEKEFSFRPINLILGVTIPVLAGLVAAFFGKLHRHSKN